MTWKGTCLPSKQSWQKLTLRGGAKQTGFTKPTSWWAFFPKEYLHIGTNMSYFPLSRWNNACYSTANILVTCAKTPKQREKPLLPLERQNLPNSPSRNCSKSSTQLVICFWMLRSPTSTSKTKWQQTDKAAFQRSWQIFQKFSCALPRIPCRGPTGATRVTSVSGGVTGAGNMLVCLQVVTAEAAEHEIHTDICSCDS